MQIYNITPVPKPRMTKRDTWDKRPCVVKYWAFKDALKRLKMTLPYCNYHLILVRPMPKSWSKAKKREMNGQPHQPTPDKDNMEKAILDSLFEDDSGVWDGRVTKFWGYSGAIIVRECEKVVNLQQFGDFDCMKEVANG